MTIEFKRGTSLLWRDLKDFLSGDLWPWLQLVAAIIFVGVLLLFPTVFPGNYVASVLWFLTWLAFNLYAMWRTSQEEEF